MKKCIVICMLSMALGACASAGPASPDHGTLLRFSDIAKEITVEYESLTSDVAATERVASGDIAAP